DEVPTETLASLKTALARDQLSVRGDDDGMQEPDVLDAGGEPFNVAEIATMALADDDLLDRAARHGAPPSPSGSVFSGEPTGETPTGSRTRRKPTPSPAIESRAASPMLRTRKASTSPRYASNGSCGSCPAAIRSRHKAKTGEDDRTLYP